MYKTLQKIEEILEDNVDITGYKLIIYIKDKNYIIDKPESEIESVHTNAIGFQIDSKTEYEEDEE